MSHWINFPQFTKLKQVQGPPMSVPKHRIQGKLLTAGERAAMLLDEAAESLFLRYALVDQATSRHLLPEVLLDDWGSEIRGLAIYAWIEKNGLYFPRAEVFGFDLKGREKQFFIRELDLMARYPCYAYAQPDSPLPAGVLVEAMLIMDEGSGQPQRIKRPAGIERPLTNSAVAWWLVPLSDAEEFDFGLLGDPLSQNK
jgi:hypothetical protein